MKSTIKNITVLFRVLLLDTDIVSTILDAFRVGYQALNRFIDHFCEFFGHLPYCFHVRKHLLEIQKETKQYPNLLGNGNRARGMRLKCRRVLPIALNYSDDRAHGLKAHMIPAARFGGFGGHEIAWTNQSSVRGCPVEKRLAIFRNHATQFFHSGLIGTVQKV